MASLSSGCTENLKRPVARCMLICFHLQASSDLAATYAALILADDGVEITVRTHHFGLVKAKFLTQADAHL